jgi:molybdate transport system substrate-binding protein
MLGEGIIMHKAIAGALALIASGLLGLSPGSAAEVKLISSVGVKGVLDLLVPAFEKASGTKVDAVFATSAAVKTRIEGGEAFDIAVLSPAAADAFIEQGKATGPRVDLAKAGCGIAIRAGMPTPDLSSDERLKAFLLNAKSISSSDPAGGGFSAITFTKLAATMGIADALRSKMIYARPGEGAAPVAKGEADIGVGLISEIMPVHGVVAVPLKPDDPATFISFAAVLSSAAKGSDAAKALLAYIQSPAAKEVLKAQGMTTP